MSLLEKLVLRHACRTAYDLVAISALGHLNCADSERWKNLVLINHDDFLRGVRAPQASFKDFPDHVLHIEEGEWGGLRARATHWYGEVVARLRSRQWHKAAYALGVLSFYHACACNPLNTQQTEEKAAIKTAFDRVGFRAWPEIELHLCDTGFPALSTPDGRGFVSSMIAQAATSSSDHFATVIDTFDFAAAASGDDSLIDAELVDVYADFLGRAISGFAHLMDQAIAEAGQAPRKVPIKLLGYLSIPSMPLHGMKAKRVGKSQDRKIRRMFAEVQQRGKALKSLPAEERILRKLYAEQILRIPLKALDQTPLTAIGRLLDNEADIADEACAPQADTPAPKSKSAEAEKLPSVVPELDDEDDGELVESIADTLDEIEGLASKDIPPETSTEIEGDESELEFDAETQAKVDALINEKLDSDIEIELTEELEAEIAAEIAAERAAESKDEFENDEIDEEFSPEEPNDWKPSKLSPNALVADALLLDELVENELHAAGIMTVEDLLCVDVEELAEFIDEEDIPETMISDWQDQVMLMMRVGGLRALDAQILIATGIRTADELASSSASDVFKAAKSFLERQIGDQLLDPEEAHIDESDAQSWIDLANQA